MDVVIYDLQKSVVTSLQQFSVMHMKTNQIKDFNQSEISMILITTLVKPCGLNVILNSMEV